MPISNSIELYKSTKNARVVVEHIFLPAAGSLFTTLILTAIEIFRDITKQILTASLHQH